MRSARSATVRGPVPVVRQGQEASSGPVGFDPDPAGHPGAEGVAKGTKSVDDAGRGEVGQSELVEEAKQ